MHGRGEIQGSASALLPPAGKREHFKRLAAKTGVAFEVTLLLVEATPEHFTVIG